MEGVQHLIDKINSRMLNVTAAQLESINNIIVVAGTSRKALAIRELLEHSQYNIRYLCTDSIAARKILEAQPKSAYHPALPPQPLV